MEDLQFPRWDSAAPTPPLPWREGLGEGEKHTPGIVKLCESPRQAGGLPMIIRARQ
jgi:hypothetical protein